MAAEVLGAAGAGVDVYDRMPTVGRKFLMAGRGGLNLTHSEPFETFVSRYGAAAARLRPILEAFPPAKLIEWAEGLNEPTFVGSSGRVFPKSMKASPLLRAWLARLRGYGVQFHLHHEWRGWDDSGALLFRRPDGADIRQHADATILALGGASWPKLGSDGRWAAILAREGVELSPLVPSNCGFTVGWSDMFRTRFAGQPLKNIALSFGGRTIHGECTITAYGIEGSAIYALSAPLRDAIAPSGPADIFVDLRPDATMAHLREKLARARKGESISNVLRKAGLSPLEINLLREGHGAKPSRDTNALAERMKTLPLTLFAPQPITRAISTGGGVTWSAVDDHLMLRRRPGTFVAGEMLDWEAPTGGYLLQACFATGATAAHGVLRHLRS
jgi:uncharacterized flavoprotein (TIGR03862 family)